MRRPSHIPCADHTLGARLTRAACAHPDEEALTAGAAGRRWTYDRFANDVDLLALGLIGKDVRPGERIAVWGPGHADLMLVLFAAARIGAVLVHVDPARDDAGLRRALHLSAAELLFTAYGREERAEAVWDACPALRDVVLVADDAHGELSGWSEPMDLGLQMSRPERVDARAAEVSCGDTAVLRFAAPFAGVPPVPEAGLPSVPEAGGASGTDVGVPLDHHDLLDPVPSLGALLDRAGPTPF